MSRRHYSNTASQALLAADVGSSDPTLSFVAGTYGGYPAVPFTAALERGTPQEEIVLVTATAPNSATVTRGYDGTTPTSHASGSTFLHVVVAMDYDEANAHHNASTGVHGVTGAVVGTSDAQTLSNKTLAAPTLTGAASGDSLSLASTLAVTGAAALSAAVTIGGLLTGAAATLSGLLTANGGITVPTGKTVTITDTPAAGTSGVNKTYADGLGTAAATASTIMRRDANGRTAVAAPAAAGDAANQGYVLGLGSWRGSATAHPGSPIAGDRYLRTNLGNTVFGYTGTAWRQLDPAVAADATARTGWATTDLHAGFRAFETATGTRWEWNGSLWLPLDPVFGKMWRTTASGTSGVSAQIAQAVDTKITMDASRVAGGFTFDNTNDTLTIPVDGLYDLDGCIYWSGSGSWYATGFINRLRSAATLTVAASDLHLHAGTIDARSHWAGRKVPLKAGDVVSLSAYNYTGGAADCRVSASSEALGCSLTITYVSPLNGATPL